MGTTCTCILCESYKPTDGRAGSPQGEDDFDTPTTKVECPRCGSYSVDRDISAEFSKGLDEDLGLLLSAVARAETDAGRRLVITRENYQQLADFAPRLRTYTARVDWLLSKLANICKYPGRTSRQLSLETLAAGACLPLKDCDALLYQMQGEQLLGIADRDMLRYRVSLQPKGWARVDALQATSPRGDRAFVAMWFADEMKLAYEKGIKPALLSCGYESPFRVVRIPEALEQPFRNDLNARSEST